MDRPLSLWRRGKNGFIQLYLAKRLKRSTREGYTFPKEKRSAVRKGRVISRAMAVGKEVYLSS